MRVKNTKKVKIKKLYKPLDIRLIVYQSNRWRRRPYYRLIGEGDLLGN